MMANYIRILIGLAAAVAIFAQTQSPTEFEVASVRPNRLDDHIVTIDVGPGGRFAARGYTLVLLMQRAYGVMDWNVTGGPGWIRTDRYDVTAKAMVEGNLTERQLKPMLQKLLAERFNLRLHRVSKEMSGYALIVRKDGPKLKPAADSEEHADTFRLNNAGLSGQGISMENFARYVGGKMGLVAVDMTGLKGFYDFNVRWTVEADQNADMRDALRPVVFAALQNQLGLKLNAQKISVETLVIDSVEKASEN
jgi:uncharacterized protein (TIGR03435 family)